MAEQVSDAQRDHDYLHAEGKSTAAWAGVGVCLLGFLLGAIALPFGMNWLFIVGVVLAIGGGVLGKVLTDMGYGVGGDKNRH